MIGGLLRIIVTALPAVVFVVVWQLAVRDDPRLQFLFGSPALIAAVAIEELSSHSFWWHLIVTCTEAILGLVLGAAAGTGIGLLLWGHERIARLARPYVVLLGAVPIFAIAPMLIIWFGTGLLSKVIMSAFAVFFVSLSQAYDGAAACAREHGQYARSLGAPRRLVVAKIIVPGALRWVVAGLKISVGLALVGAFIGEFVSSQAGLGHYILAAGALYDMPRVLFGVLVLSLVALTLTGVIWGVERYKPHLFAK